MSEIRVLICGDRNWTDGKMIQDLLVELHAMFGEQLRVCHGAARGADSMAGRLCKEQNIDCQPFPARWSQYGRAAGPIRNREMLDSFRPEAVFAFHDDIEHSKGTKDMITRAKSRGLRVTVKSHATSTVEGG